MAVMDDVRAEERAARERERNLARGRRQVAQQRETEMARKIREAATETRERHPHCKCDFRGIKTREQLRKMGCGCTDPRYVCPRLLAVRTKVSA